MTFQEHPPGLSLVGCDPFSGLMDRGRTSATGSYEHASDGYQDEGDGKDHGEVKECLLHPPPRSEDRGVRTESASKPSTFGLEENKHDERRRDDDLGDIQVS